MVNRGTFRNLTPKEITWLWKPYIPFGKVTLIQGDTGIGKTSLIVKLMADLSRGLYPPTMYRGQLQEQERGDPLKTFYVSIENCIEDTILPMFILQGGDIEIAEYQDEMGGHFLLNGDDIRECVRISGAKLIVIDPWQQFLDDASSTDNNAMRAMIRDIQNAAEETGTAVVLCGNYTKTSVRSELNRGIGAAELFNTLRCVLTVKEGQEKNERELIVSKMSLPGSDNTPPVYTQDEDGRFKFSYNPMHSLNRSEERNTEEHLPKNKETETFLRGLLSAGSMDSNDVKKAIQEAGYSMSTVYRIKDRFVAIDRLSDRSTIWRLK